MVTGCLEKGIMVLSNRYLILKEIRFQSVLTYDALVSERLYKRKLRHGEAVRMIINGECGAFSMKLLQCFLAAAMQKEWVQKVETDTEA